MYGLKSSCLYRFAATYATPASCGDGSMRLMSVCAAIILGVTFVHFPPLFRDTLIRPSSLPAHSTPGSTVDSAKAKIVAWYSAPVWSSVIGPPESPVVFGSLRVRSGLTRVHDVPSSFERCTYWEVV